jgi:hypothetical protein
VNGCIISELIVLIKLIPSCHQPYSHLSVTLKPLPYLGKVADKEFYVIKGCIKRSGIPFYILRIGLKRLEDFSNIFKLLLVVSYKNVVTKLLLVIFRLGYKFLMLL